MSKITEVKENVAGGKTKLVAGLVQEALDEGADAREILAVMSEAMGEVGEKFSSGELFTPEMLLAARAMQKGVDVLKPLLAEEGAPSYGKCIIGTVEGDLHDIGKNLVALMLASSGFEVIDLGVDVKKEKFIDAIKANPDVKIVACSSLLTTTLTNLENTVKGFKADKANKFKVLVGGAPMTRELANSIGADGYALDAGAAVLKAKELVC